tara:strand:+ start:3980 stop:5218 length:1239 start_codon:yes stop_codon:yes gene_type:complete
MNTIQKSFIIIVSLTTSLLFSQITHEVRAGNFYYSPSDISIDTGDTVKWINDGGFHDVEFTSGPELYSLPACQAPCDIGEITFDVAGTYEYICSIGSHAANGMVGTILVNQPVNPTSSVQIIHNSASPTVDIYVDGTLAVEDFEYRTATPILDLPTSFTVGIAPADGDVIAEFPFDLAEGGSYVVVATGLLGNETTPFDLAASGTTFGASDGNVGLNVYHGSTDAPSVDVLADGGVLVSDLSYGSFSGYVEVAANDYTIGIAPTGGDSIADFVAPLSGLSGNSAVVFASGFLSGDDPVFGLYAALEDGTVLMLESGSLSIESNLNDIFTLYPNYPNPFNPLTNINYQVNETSNISINIYDINGKFVEELFNGYLNAGMHSIEWNASGVASGTYILQINNENYMSTQKLVLLK